VEGAVGCIYFKLPKFFSASSERPALRFATLRAFAKLAADGTGQILLNVFEITSIGHIDLARVRSL
jgi:hypothetical protein